MSRPVRAQLTGCLLIAIACLVTAREWGAPEAVGIAADLAILPLVALLVVDVGWGRRIFAVVAALLVLAAMATRADWPEAIDAALRSGAFIAAFFTALATLRTASGTSPAIASCGRFLASQPPGRRYAALTVGGSLFGLILNYGALVLLGSLAEANARAEPDPEIRRHRVRRMLLAIQRGFVTTLAWSPLAFAMAITTSLVPGARWAEAVWPCLVNAAILALLGWGLDTIFKPRLAVRPAPPAREGGWGRTAPLLALLLVLVAGVALLQLLGEVRTVGAVMLLVPILAVLWIAVQTPARPFSAVATRARDYAVRELPDYRSEILLLVMAGVIGTLGASLLVPVLEAEGLSLAVLPGWAILVAMVWLLPLLGQVGMNPILSVSLLVPLLPAPAEMGVTPADAIVAITGGWALCGASSPFTATTLMIGHIGGVSASHVGIRWNGAYTVLAAGLISAWVLVRTAM